MTLVRKKGGNNLPLKGHGILEEKHEYWENQLGSNIQTNLHGIT
jgi:hypothetical protein